ncbi:MAG: hypothetical protein AAGC47_04100 [Bacteroidota bacterium]
MTKRLGNILLLMAAAAIALAIIFNEFLAYSAIFIGAMIVFYGLYGAFLKTKDEQIDTLKETLEREEEELEKVKTENEELRSRKFNLSSVRQILDVGLFEIDTNFTRTWNEELTTGEGKTVQFIGALKVDIVAKYGVDLQELRIKQTEDGIELANLNLKSLSFSDLNYKWVIAEVLEHKKPYLGSSHRRTNTVLDIEANKIKERLQEKTHEEVKNGPEEMEALTAILKSQMVHSVAAVLGYEQNQVKLVDDSDSSFKQLDQLA